MHQPGVPKKKNGAENGPRERSKTSSGQRAKGEGLIEGPRGSQITPAGSYPKAGAEERRQPDAPSISVGSAPEGLAEAIEEASESEEDREIVEKLKKLGHSETVIREVIDKMRNLRITNAEGSVAEGSVREVVEKMKKLGMLGTEDQPTYSEIELLGAGGMGYVFKAKDNLDRHVVIKVMLGDLEAKASPHERFMNEAKAAAAIDHENVVKIYTYRLLSDEKGEKDHFIVMEYLEGESLLEMMEEGSLDCKRACEIAMQICAGLAAAHSKGVIHRDIKPDNIFITKKVNEEDGTLRDHVKILDFGIAKVQSPGKKYQTQEGAKLGTLEYMSCEQAKGSKDIDYRTDLWSVGAVLYHAVTGFDPFHREDLRNTPVAMIGRILTAPPIPPRERGVNIPLELEGIIMRCLAKDPNERYGSAMELRNAVKEAIKKLDVALEDTDVMKAVGALQGPVSEQVVVPPDSGVGQQVAMPPDSGVGQQVPGSSPWAVEPTEAGIAPEALPSSHVLSEATPQYVAGALPQQAAPVSSEVPQITPSERASRLKPTMVGITPEQKRKKNRRIIFAGVLGAGILGAGAAGLTLMSRGPNEKPERVQKIGYTIPRIDIKKPEVPPALPAETHEILFQFNTDNVQVFRGEEFVCETKKSKECSATLPEGKDAVTFTFKRKGFKETTEEIVPDKKKTIKVTLKPIRKGPIGPRIPRITADDYK